MVDAQGRSNPGWVGGQDGEDASQEVPVGDRLWRSTAGGRSARMFHARSHRKHAVESGPFLAGVLAIMQVSSQKKISYLKGS